MSKPPSDVPPDELWLKLNETAPSEIFDFPRKGPDGKPIGKVRIVVLRQEHHTMAKIQAHATLKKDAARREIETLTKDDLESPGIKSAMGDQVSCELLAMSLQTVTPVPGSETSDNPRYSYLFHGADDVRKKLNAEEIAVLFSAYLLTQNKYGPFESNLEKSDVDAWIRRLEVGGSSFPLAHLPWPQLAELTFSLAGRISTVSRILESQRESLPDTLVSSLEPYFTGTYSSGELPDGSTRSSWESSAEATDMATRFAQSNRDGDSDSDSDA